MNYYHNSKIRLFAPFETWGVQNKFGSMEIGDINILGMQQAGDVDQFWVSDTENA